MESPPSTLGHPLTISKYNFSPAVIGAATNLLERDYSIHSRKAIIADLKNFLTWYSEKNGEVFTFERVTPRDIADYRDDCRRKGLAVKTVNRRLVSVRLFLDVAVDQGFITKNPAKGVRQLTGQALAPQSLTMQDTRKFLREVEIRGNPRDRLLIELMLGAGLRVSEAVDLTINDIQLSERKGTITIRNGKGNKERHVPLHSSVRKILSEYLATQRPTDRLFKGQRGDLTAMGAHFIVKKYAAKAGLDIHCHTLRHTFAMNYLRTNPSGLQPLSQLLGHSSLDITSIYTQHRIEELEEGIERMTY